MNERVVLSRLTIMFQARRFIKAASVGRALSWFIRLASRREWSSPTCHGSKPVNYASSLINLPRLL